MNWNDKVILVTGGTGSFGKKFIEIMLKEFKPAKLIVYSRDEQKQHEMRQMVFNMKIYATSLVIFVTRNVCAVPSRVWTMWCTQLP